VQLISGFSKLDKLQKIETLVSLGEIDVIDQAELNSFLHSDEQTQKLFDEFSENTLSNFYIPFGIAPNFIINQKKYSVPMAIEESSVVAAACRSAKFWAERSGFNFEVIDKIKIGNIHFFWEGEDSKLLNDFLIRHKPQLFNDLAVLNKNMQKRQAGLIDVELVDKSSELKNYYKFEFKFKTADAMGANYINSMLEKAAELIQQYLAQDCLIPDLLKKIDINMCILSNYTPQCLVKAWVECDVAKMKFSDEMTGETFVRRFIQAINIAKVDPYRAVTHNKGIMNGVDALVLATGNDFRAIEACAHAYAAKDGHYKSLTDACIHNNKFYFSITLPLSVGVVGGLTSLHPLAKIALKILKNPSADELMGVMACLGLAQNFSAVQSLVTTGIQKGHMKMHLLNILKQLRATEDEIRLAKAHFEHNIVSFSAVRDFLNQKSSTSLTQ
jgi:hydroxymethylglutaryl-CoA reductase